MRAWGQRSRSWGWVLTLLAVAFPLLRLWPLDGQFQVDWYNHKWLTAYAGEFLREHGSLPTVLNTDRHAGMPYPIFYGTLFYPLLAVFSTVINPAFVIRIAAVFVTWLEFRLITRALRRMDVRPWLATGIACLVIWAIYPLTNLYSRSAITEYVATALLTSAVATWFLLLHEPAGPARTRLALGFGLLFALTAGVHPITALYSVPVLLLLPVAAYQEHGRDRAYWTQLAKVLALPIALALVVLAPWVYALHAFKAYLHVGATAGLPWFYPDSLDAATTRFSPLPYDVRTSNADWTTVETPWLDAQINGPLLVLLLSWLAFFVWTHRGNAAAVLRAVLLAMCAFGVFTWLSLSPSAYDSLPSIARMIQIAYRLITYQNLSLLLALFMFAGLVRRRNLTAPLGKPFAALVAGCLLLSVVGVVIKSGHATTIMHRDGSARLRPTRTDRATWVTLPSQFYGFADYATPRLFTKVTGEQHAAAPDVRFPIGTGDQFGVPQPVATDYASATWVRTDVQAFPWNHLVLDGEIIPADRVRVDSISLSTEIPAGLHTLELVTTPDGTWRALRLISYATLALWIFGVVVLTGRAALRGRTGSAVPP